MNIAVRKSWAEQHSGEIKSFLLALRDAHHFIGSNTAEAQEMLSGIVQLPLEIVLATWDLYDFSLKFDLESQVNVTRSVAKLALASDPSLSGLPLPDYSPYFDDRYFNAISSADTAR